MRPSTFENAMKCRWSPNAKRKRGKIDEATQPSLQYAWAQSQCQTALKKAMKSCAPARKPQMARMQRKPSNGLDGFQLATVPLAIPTKLQRMEAQSLAKSPLKPSTPPEHAWGIWADHGWSHMTPDVWILEKLIPKWLARVLAASLLTNRSNKSNSDSMSQTK